MKKIFLKQIECRYCHCIFYMCQSCWRGHCYCSDACRRENKRKQHNKSQQCYRQTKKGKATHKKSEQRRRIRQSERKKKFIFLWACNFFSLSILKQRIRYNQHFEAFSFILNHKNIKKNIKTEKTMDDRGSTEPCKDVSEHGKVFCTRRCCHFCGKSGPVVREFPHREYGGKYSEPVFANSP